MRGNYVNKLCKLLSKLKDLSLLIMGMLLLHRCIQKLKKKIRNKARVEAAMVEAFLVEEVTNNLSLYFKSTAPSKETRYLAMMMVHLHFKLHVTLKFLNARVDALVQGVFVTSQMRNTRLLSCTY